MKPIAHKIPSYPSHVVARKNSSSSHPHQKAHNRFDRHFFWYVYQP